MFKKIPKKQENKTSIKLGIELSTKLLYCVSNDCKSYITITQQHNTKHKNSNNTKNINEKKKKNTTKLSKPTGLSPQKELFSLIILSLQRDGHNSCICQQTNTIRCTKDSSGV